MSNEKESLISKKANNISLCDVLKEDTSKIIRKLESQVPSNLQQYSDLYSAYLHYFEDIFGTCYISEKEFFEKLNIDQDILAAYQKSSNFFTNFFIDHLDLYSKMKEQNIKVQISNLKICDNFMHSMIDSYTKFLSSFNQTSSGFYHYNQNNP